MKKTYDLYEVETTTQVLTDELAADSEDGKDGKLAYSTFNGEEIEISTDKLIPFHATDHVIVSRTLEEKEVDDPTCQGDEPPTPPTPKPTITGADDVSIIEGDTFDPMAGVSAEDYEGNPLEVTVSGSVDTDVPGDYYLTYSATDSHGNTTTVRRKVTVVELGAPVINGANDVTLNQGVGIDLADGVTATLDGEPIEFTYDPTELDECEIGSHTVVYSATGNGKTTTVNRVVTITEIADPTISGLTALEVEVDEQFNPLDGVSAVDGNGNTLTVTTDAPTSYDTLGTYTISYTAEDDCGNTTTETRSVHVVQEPYFVGLTNESSPQGIDFDLSDGVTAYDEDGQSVAFTVSPSEVAICEVGTQTFTYTAGELTGTREITITAIPDPVISGADTKIRVVVGDEFDPMAGVTAVDGNGETIAVSGEAVPVAYVSYDTSNNRLTFFKDEPGKYGEEEVIGTKTYLTDIEANYTASTPRWNRWANDATSIVFEDEIKPAKLTSFFNGFNKVTSITDLDKLDTSLATDMGGMFYGCEKLTSLDLSNFDTSNVTGMGEMFMGTFGLTELDLSSFDMSNVTLTASMCAYTGATTIIFADDVNTSQVTNAHSMFKNSENLTNIVNIDKFDTSNMYMMQSMFVDCSSLGEVDLSGFSFVEASYAQDMFRGTSNLKTELVINGMPENYSGMFKDCATESGAEVIVKYVAPVTSADIDTLVATKSASSNVVNGGEA